MQTAVDYAMHLNHGPEDASELLPHVAAVAAFYGDSDGKYKAFLDASAVVYKSQPWWFFDQPEAVGPMGSKRDVAVGQESNQKIELDLGGIYLTSNLQASTTSASESVTTTTSTGITTITSSTMSRHQVSSTDQTPHLLQPRRLSHHPQSSI